MNALVLRSISFAASVTMAASGLHASDALPPVSDQPSSAVFLAARLKGADTLEVRASEATNVETVNAIRDAFGAGSDLSVSISVVPTIRHCAISGTNAVAADRFPARSSKTDASS